MKIIPYSDKYKDQTTHFILEILEGEFGFVGIKRPDLYKIPEIYQKKKNNFWLAVEDEKVIGTIALCNYRKNRGYLKRMYIDKNFRGKGIAQKLLETLLAFAKSNSYKELFLGTVEKMIAANRFYSKVGFQRINSLPIDIPEFGDTVFYKMDI